MQTVLLQSGPCLVTTPCYNRGASFWRPTEKQLERYRSKAKDEKENERARLPVEERDLDLLPPPKRFHCTLAVGLMDQGLILRNCWGPHWNGSVWAGHCLFPFSDFPKYALEVHAIDGVNMVAQHTAQQQ